MNFGFFYLDPLYLYLVVPALLLAGLASANVQNTFYKYRGKLSKKGYTGAQVARKILDAQGLTHIRIERVPGKLSDHYDPRSGVIRLSDSVYSDTSVAALGVAAHEVGHAIQHSVRYSPLTLRNAIIPITNFGSTISIPLVMLGFFMSNGPLITAGILLFSTVAFFQLITLPVEFNASRRALAILGTQGILEAEELQGASKVLKAAAMTYVAALLVTVAQLLRLLLILGRRNNE